ncbi:hypothetical protein [Peribacillus simplex]|uniref:hypothetical protein n=1 Tax=Peribacillus simplex TaxID=1478 RepID=UPI003D2C1047
MNSRVKGLNSRVNGLISRVKGANSRVNGKTRGKWRKIISKEREFTVKSWILDQIAKIHEFRNESHELTEQTSE